MTLKEIFQNWKLKRESKKAGYNSVKTYLKSIDPSVNKRGSNVYQWYCGYKHYTRVERPDLYVQVDHIIAWCEKNCKGVWRYDWLRVGDVSQIETEVIDHIFGADYMYFAFKNSTDYNWFNLKWK